MALEKLIIEDIVEGTGPGVAAGDRISVHYTGKFEDGTVFDSSVERGEPIDFTCGVGMVIPGWDQGLIGLKKGEMDKVPVQSPAGFHVVKVEDVRPAELYPKYEARKEELRHILLQRKVQAFIHEQVLRAEVKDAK